MEKILIFLHLSENVIQLLFPAHLVLLEDFIDSVLEEYPLQRTVVPVVLELSELYLKLTSENIAGMEGVVLEYVIDRQELRLIFLDYAGIGINRCFAVGECVESVYCLVRGNVVRKVDYDFNLFGCHVLNLLDFDFAFVLGFQD